MRYGSLFSTTISPSKPLLFFPDTDTEITNIALDPSSSKPSTSATAIEPVIIKLQYEGVKIEDEEDDDEEDEEKAAKRAAKIHKEVIGDDEDEDDEDDEDGDDTSSSDELEQKEVVICSLVPGQILQSSVNILLVANDAYRFVVSGGAYDVHLLGRYVLQEGADDDDDDDLLDYSSDDESLDSDELGAYDDDDLASKVRLGLTDGPILYDSEDDDSEDDDEEDSYDEDEDDDEGRIQELLDEAEDLQAEAAVDSKKSPAKVNGTAAGSKKRPLAADVMEEDEEDDEPAVDVSMASAADSVDTSKLSKNQRKKLAKKLKAANGEAVPAPVAAASDKKAAPAAKATEAAATKKSAPAAAAGAAVTLPSGLKYVDSKPGSGPACKPGQKVSMRYIGKLASNGKTFDKNTAGAPFRFQLGKGEVIKGWDEGVKGMAVGGERKLTVPAALAYGKRGAPPDIPPNATLVFDVKLLKIN